MKKILLFLFVSMIFASCSWFNPVDTDLIPVMIGKKYGYINADGDVKINPQFEQAALFRCGLALVAVKDSKSNKNDIQYKWGFIDKDGDYVVQPQYKRATSFSEGIAWVVREGKAPEAINKKGEVLFTLKDAEEVQIFKDGLAAFSVINKENEEKWGFVNIHGEVVITPQFDGVGLFNDEICAVYNDKEKKVGFIDKEGKLIINYQFDNALDFQNGIASVKLDDDWGIIDEDGKYVINPQFDNIIPDGDWFMMGTDDQYGWCDEEGKYTINPQFSDVRPFFDNDLAPVKIDDEWGFINKKGKIVISAQFVSAYPFIDDIAVVGTKEKFGFIDEEGKYVINPQYAEIGYDYLLYSISNIYCAYGIISTDYINTNAYTSAFNLENPGGLSLESTYAEIMEKYNLSETDFSKYLDKTTLLDSTIGNRFANYRLIAIGNPYKEIQNNSSYFYYTDYAFDSSLKPKCYEYDVSFSYKSPGKEQTFIDAVKKYISSKYPLDMINSNDQVSVYTNENRYVYLVISKDEENNTPTGFSIIISSQSIPEYSSLTSKEGIIEEPAVAEVE